MSIDETAYKAAEVAYDAAFPDAIGVTYDGLKAAIEAYAAAKAKPQSYLSKNQPCGCVLCTCDNDDRCLGCRSKHCGNHTIGYFPEGGLWTFGDDGMNHERVAIPIHADEAAMMMFLGRQFLEKHAPERLRKRESSELPEVDKALLRLSIHEQFLKGGGDGVMEMLAKHFDISRKSTV